MIKFDNVYKTYTGKNDKVDVEALKGVDLFIDDGEFVFIIGKSGSGKSTLMKCITCEETPTSGTVSIDNFDISHMSRALVPVLRRQIGMIYQDFRLIETKTVFENVSFAGEIIGIPRKTLNQTVQLMLNVVGLRDKADSYPEELSGGEQQRVAIARAMVNDPQLIVADEPTGNLDPETSENIMALLLEINKRGTTVVVCTHDSNLVNRMQKRVIEIGDGKVVRDQEDSGYERAPELKLEYAGTPSNVAFGDDPAFSHDSDYSDNFDDEDYEAENSSVEAEEAVLPEVPAIPQIQFGDEPASPLPVPVPAEVIVENDISDLIDETVPEETSAVEEPVEELPAPVEFGDAKEEESEEVSSDDVLSLDEEPVNEIPLQDIDIDFDISEDDDE